MTSDLPELLGRCLDLLEAEGPEALETFLGEHSEHADSLRQRLELLQGIGFVRPQASTTVPQRLGPFRILDRVGGGGMGVVYRAEQEPLGRLVALKLIRPDLLPFDQAHERFHREVEVVSQLQHPGIVPVFVGGKESGIPYYAMELIHGCSLSQVLISLKGRRPGSLRGLDLQRAIQHQSGADETPTQDSPQLFEGTWVETCFRLVLQASQALAYAHDQGVLHRDIKPSNIMVDHHGRVMLVDFGLASTQDSEQLTRSGSQVGSLAYMAPEQLQGMSDSIDARTDLYALGVTLYELLTLQAPYLSGEPERTRRQILEGRPTAIRKLHPQVPWDAETVCLSAMERDRSRRYPSAHHFVQDLRNVLEHRVIQARRPGPLLRLQRFVQRHPTASTAAVLAFLLLGASWIYAVKQQRISTELALAVAEAHLHRQEAEAETERAERNYQRAFGAANQLVRIGFERLQNIPGFDDVREDLLSESEQFYRGFLEEKPNDPDVRFEMARNLRLIAQGRASSLQYEAAAVGYQQAARLLRELLQENPASGKYRWQLATCDNQMGILASIEGNQDLAVDHLENAIVLFEELVAESEAGEGGNLFDLHKSLIGSLVNLAGAFLERADFDAADECYQQGYDLALILAQEDSRPTSQKMLAAVLNNWCALLIADDRPEEALEVGLECLDHVETLEQTLPKDAELRLLLSQVHGNIGSAYLALEQVGEAAEALALGSQRLRRLSRDFPENLLFVQYLCSQLKLQGRTLIETGELEQALRTLEEASQRIRWLLARRGRTLDSVSEDFFIHRTLGNLLLREQQLDAAEQAFETARRAQQLIRQHWPSDFSDSAAADLLHSFAQLRRSQGRESEAADLEQAARSLQVP